MLQKDGTVLATGDRIYGPLNWAYITVMSMGQYHLLFFFFFFFVFFFFFFLGGGGCIMYIRKRIIMVQNIILWASETG